MRVKIGGLLWLWLCCAGLALSAESTTPFPGVPRWSYQLLETLPHDPMAYTQGLLIDAGDLFEGTGLRGRSELRRLDLASGRLEARVALADAFFGEGIALVGDRLLQLTWRAGVGLIYRRQDLQLLGQFSYSGEGWGLAFDGRHLLRSDGSEWLWRMDPQTLETLDGVAVRDAQDRPVRWLNELEWVEGRLLANQYTTDRILVIDPEQGRLLAWLDLAPLEPGVRQRDAEAVLNGIAWDPATASLYVTGKRWPVMYRLRLELPAGL